MLAHQRLMPAEGKQYTAQLQLQPQSMIDEITAWADDHLDYEIIDGTIETFKNEQEVIRRKREKYVASCVTDGMLIIKSREGANFVLHSAHATQTCRGVQRMLEAQRDPDMLASPVSMSFDCSSYVLDRIIHFWLFKVVEIRKIKTLEHIPWHPSNTLEEGRVTSMSTVGALIEFYTTVVNNRDDLARRVVLAKLRSHLLSPVVTDDEIFEGLTHAYQVCASDNNTGYSEVLKRIFLSVLVRNGLRLTMGKNKGRVDQIVTAFPALAMDAWRGEQFYRQFYGKKNEE